MEAHGQHQAPVDKRHRVPNKQEAGWVPEPVRTLGAEKILVPLPKIEPRSLCHPSLSSVSVTNTLNWFLYYMHPRELRVEQWTRFSPLKIRSSVVTVVIR